MMPQLGREHLLVLELVRRVPLLYLALSRELDPELHQASEPVYLFERV